MRQLTDNINTHARKIPEWAIYLLGLVPAAVLTLRLFTGGLGVDPVKVVEHQLGLTGLQFLIATLAVTPVRRLLNINLLKMRRALGMLAFIYIALHLLAWLLLDIQLLWGQIGADILKRPYITIGMIAFVLMLPLAMTSNNTSLRRLGAVGWRRIHKLVYVIAPLGAVHFVLIVKGWQIEPFIYLGIILALLVLRIRAKRLGVFVKSATRAV